MIPPILLQRCKFYRSCNRGFKTPRVQRSAAATDAALTCCTESPTDVRASVDVRQSSCITSKAVYCI